MPQCPFIVIEAAKGSGVQCFLVGAVNDQPRIAFAALAQDLGLTFATSSGLEQLKADRQFVNASQALVLIPDAPQAPLDVDKAIAFAQEQADHAFVVCLTDTMESGDYKRLVRTGVAEWIAWPQHHEELRDLVARLHRVAAPERAAKILSFVPSKGGVGNTTLVIEAAMTLAARYKRSGARVAILDLNLQGGTVADALDVEPRFDVTEIVDRPERLDEQLIDIFTSRYAKDVDVFASPLSRIDIDSVKPEIVFAFIDAITSRYDAILFDLPAQWLAWTDNVLRGSDGVIVMGGESVPELRRLAATCNHVDGLGIADKKVAVVVNAVATNLLGGVSRHAIIERALGKRRFFCVRRDGESLAKALDVGRPVGELAPNSRLVADVKRITEWIESAVALSPSLNATSKASRRAMA